MPITTSLPLLEQARKLDFIIEATQRGLTYKEASALWADGIDELYDSMVD